MRAKVQKNLSYLLPPIMVFYALAPSFLFAERVSISKIDDNYPLDTKHEFSLAQNPFSYSGYYRDFESKVYYLKARYYSPKLARFVSRDTYDLSNRYAYCSEDSINKTDPGGHFPIAAMVAFQILWTATNVVLMYGAFKTDYENIDAGRELPWSALDIALNIVAAVSTLSELPVSVWAWRRALTKNAFGQESKLGGAIELVPWRSCGASVAPEITIQKLEAGELDKIYKEQKVMYRVDTRSPAQIKADKGFSPGLAYPGQVYFAKTSQHLAKFAKFRRQSKKNHDVYIYVVRRLCDSSEFTLDEFTNSILETTAPSYPWGDDNIIGYHITGWSDA